MAIFTKVPLLQRVSQRSLQGYRTGVAPSQPRASCKNCSHGHPPLIGLGLDLDLDDMHCDSFELYVKTHGVCFSHAWRPGMRPPLSDGGDWGGSNPAHALDLAADVGGPNG